MCQQVSDVSKDGGSKSSTHLSDTDWSAMVKTRSMLKQEEEAAANAAAASIAAAVIAGDRARARAPETTTRAWSY